MENLWTPLFSLTVFLIVFAVGDAVSYKTKGLISGVIIAAIVYIAGYWTGIIPTSSIASTGLPTMLTAFMIPLLLVNLGTSISIFQLLAEWKTVAIALIGLGWPGTDFLYPEQHAVHKRVRSQRLLPHRRRYHRCDHHQRGSRSSR